MTIKYECEFIQFLIDSEIERNYVSNLKAVIRYSDIDIISDKTVNSTIDFDLIKDQIIERRKKEAENSNPKNYARDCISALRKYIEFISGFIIEDYFNDIENISHDTKLDKTEKQQLINARLGQGKYRQELIDYWKSCSVTGYSDKSMLVASHIKPWAVSSNEERIDKFNGLLLVPNIDKAFDKGLISFDSNGKILISSYLKQAGLLGVNDCMCIKLKNKHKIYMAYHRDKYGF